jgi:hypothetical protein
MVSGSRACLTFILSDHPHWPSRHFDGALVGGVATSRLGQCYAKHLLDVRERQANLVTAPVLQVNLPPSAIVRRQSSTSDGQATAWVPRARPMPAITPDNPLVYRWLATE